jgi:hypothetical protein
MVQNQSKSERERVIEREREWSESSADMEEELG